MAFWKMVGLEVIPLNPSSSIRRFSSPEWISFLLRLSSQTLCPISLRPINGFLFIVHLSAFPPSSLDHFLFYLINLGQSSAMPFSPREYGSEPDANDLFGKLRSDHPRAE